MTTLQDRAEPKSPPPAPRRDRTSARRRRLRSPQIRLRKPIQHTPRTLLVNWVLIAVVGLIGWTMLYALLISSLQHAHDQAVLYAKFRQQLAEATAPLGARWCLPVDNAGGTTSSKCHTTKRGDPIAVLDLPTADLKQQVIVEGTSSGQLINGPGHKRNTPFPGVAGTSVVYGRANLFGGPFHRISSVHVGDPITVTTGEGVATYTVERVRRAGDPFPVVASGQGRLTLVTAESSGWRSGWAASGTVYVDARLTSAPFIDTGGRLPVVPQSENALKGDTNALYSLVLWLPLLVFAALGVVWAQDRWGQWQAWIVGTPVTLAALWGVTQTATQFLPNLM